MASTTALPLSSGALKRTATADRLASGSSSSSEASSPLGTPVESGSSTSLSSMGSLDELDLPTEKLAPPKLHDTYGNEFEIPDFTVKQIRDAIPAHCYVRSGAKGLAYVARDVISLATTFFLFKHFVTPEIVPSTIARGALWTLYTIIQGLFGTGLWVLAHECGHQSFSPSKTLNDTVGWVCHSALLVPYFSWKISHGKHHKGTGNVERDMAFVPRTRDQFAFSHGRLSHQLSELTEETPIATVIMLVSQQVGGWLMYLSTNVTGHNRHERQSEGRGKGKKNGFFGGVNHFDPNSPLYEAKDAHLILLSDLGLAITMGLLYLVYANYGLANLMVWYVVPYFWVNHWLGKPSFFLLQRDL